MLTLLASALLPLSTPPALPVADPASDPASPAVLTSSGTPPSARLLRAVPGDPMAFVALWDVDGIAKRGQDSAWYRFYQDQQVQNLVVALGDVVEKAMQENGGQLPFEMEALCDAIHGSLAGFVSVEPREKGDPVFLAGALFEPGENRAGLEEIFDQVIALAGEELGSASEVYGDADLTRMDAPDGDGHLVFFDHADLLGVVLSNDAESGLSAVQGSLDRFTGKDPAEGLGGSTTLLEARRSNRGAVDAEFLFDAQSLIEVILAEEHPGERTMKVLDDIGVTHLRWAYGSFGLGTGEAFDETFSLYLPPNSLLSRLDEVMGPAPIGMLELMPANAEQVSLSSFDLHRLYELVLGAVKSHDEEAYNQANGMIQMIGAMNGIDIEKDVLAQFTGEFASFLLPTTGEEPMDLGKVMMMGVAPGGALLVGLEDTDEFELFLDEMLTNFQLDQMMETEDFMGVEMKVFDMGGPAAYLAFTDEALVYASSPDPVRAAIRVSVQEEGETASDDPTFAKLVKAHPAASSISVMDTASLVKVYLGMLNELGEMMGMAGIDDRDNPFVYLPWPDAAIADKYFEGTIVSVIEISGDALRTLTYSR